LDPISYWALLNRYSSERKTVLNKFSSEVFYEHFSKLNQNVDVCTHYDDANLGEDFQLLNEELNASLSELEVSSATKSLKNGKASSVFDNILNKYLKSSEVVMLPMFCKLFNIILDFDIFPDIWSKGVILPLYKGDVNDPDNYRRITILSLFGKLFTT
jgi:hypothetical protein